MPLYKATPEGNVPMTPEEEAAFEASRVQVPQVPTAVTMRQARLALFQAGKLSAVDAAIDALPSPQKEAARIEWDYSSMVERDRPLVQQLGQALSLDIDTLFLAAKDL